MKWLSSRNFNYWFAFLARHRQNPLFAACSSCRVNNILLIWNEKKLLSLEDIFIGTVHYVMMLYSCCSDFVKQQQRNPENWWWRKERRLSQENHCDKFEHQTYSAYCKWKQSLNFHPLSLDSTRFTLFMLITPNFCMTTKSLHCKEGITLEIWYNPTHASTKHNPESSRRWVTSLHPEQRASAHKTTTATIDYSALAHPTWRCALYLYLLGWR